MAIDKYDDWLDAVAKPGNEGGKTGQLTTIKAKPGHAPNTAMGRWQMTRSTRRDTYKAMGYSGVKAQAIAEHKYQTDPNFERTVARTALVNIDNSLKGKHTASDDARTVAWTKTWYAGNPDFPDNQIPAGNVNEQPYMGEYVEGLMKTMGKSYNYSGPRWKKGTASTHSTTPIQITPMATTDVIPAKTAKSEDRSIKLKKYNQKAMTKASKLLNISQDYTPPKEEAKTPKSTWSKLADAGKDMVPYLSNLYAMGAKPAPVPRPILGQPVAMQRVNMDVDRNQAEADYRTIDRTAQATMDASSAMRAMLAGKAAKFGQMSKINEAERNTNLEIGNKEREANMAVDAANRGAMYNYNLLQAERQNAITSTRSANLANASDKFIMQQARKGQEELEAEKMGIMAKYDLYGNLKYLTDDEKKEKAMGGKLYTAGRFMKTLKPIKTIK